MPLIKKIPCKDDAGNFHTVYEYSSFKETTHLTSKSREFINTLPRLECEGRPVNELNDGTYQWLSSFGEIVLIPLVE